VPPHLIYFSLLLGYFVRWRPRAECADHVVFSSSLRLPPSSSFCRPASCCSSRACGLVGWATRTISVLGFSSQELLVPRLRAVIVWSGNDRAHPCSPPSITCLVISLGSGWSVMRVLGLDDGYYFSGPGNKMSLVPEMWVRPREGLRSIQYSASVCWWHDLCFSR